MKRRSGYGKYQNDANVEDLAGDSLILLPPEILVLISKNVREQCLKLRDYFSWFSTCQAFWEEHVNISDEQLILFILEKIQKNRNLLTKTQKSQFKHNLIEWSHFECMIRICIAVREKIVDLSQNVLSVVSNGNVLFTNSCCFPISTWKDWKGIVFNESDFVLDSSVGIIRSTTIILKNRIQWELVFIDRSTKEKRYSYFPWEDGAQKIDKKFMCFVSSLDSDFVEGEF